MGTLAQVKRGNTGLPLIVDVSYRDNNLDLTDAITLATPVVFTMTALGASTPTIDRVAAEVIAIDTAARVVTVSYNWTAGQTDIAGTYRAEFEFDVGGSPGTVPTGGYIVIEIIPGLG